MKRKAVGYTARTCGTCKGDYLTCGDGKTQEERAMDIAFCQQCQKNGWTLDRQGNRVQVGAF